MEAAEGGAAAEEVVRLLDSSLSRINWRLRPSAKRRLQTDILALCTGLRAVVMVDYGGKMPELQNHLCALLSLIRKESTILLPLRVMVVEDMIYLVHAIGLAEFALASPNMQPQLLFVDLERDPPEMLLHTDQNLIVSEMLAIQRIFSSVFPVADIGVQQLEGKTADDGFVNAASVSDIIDLSRILKDVQITIATLNGWLLGYPVVYLLSKQHAENAVRNLSTKSLLIYQISVKRKQKSGSSSFEELTSFTVPYELSLRREREPWAEAFLARLRTKFESCRHVWTDMKMEVNHCYPQSVVL